MPMIRIRSSSIQDSVHLSGVPTLQTLSDNVAVTVVVTAPYLDTDPGNLIDSESNTTDILTDS